MHISLMLMGPNQPIHNPALLGLQLCGRMEMTHEILLQDTIQQMSWLRVLQGDAATDKSWAGDSNVTWL